MSQSFNLAGPSSTTTVRFNGADCSKIMLNGTRIWERYTATQQVWVSSGYNQSGWILERSSSGAGDPRVRYKWGGYYFTLYGWYSTAVNTNSSAWYGYGKKFTTGAYYNSQWGFTYYGINQYYQGTVWVDTSSYQTQSYTAYYA